MGQTMNETPEEFLDMLKQAGVKISNERELRERMIETAQWRYSFSTMVRNGGTIGIRFDASAADKTMLHDVFAAYSIQERDEQTMTQNG